MRYSSRSMYDRLADFIVQNLDFRNVEIVLEAGCGKGQLTIPLAKRIRKLVSEFKILGLDSFSGPYHDSLDVLKKNIREQNLDDLITVIKGDSRKMNSINDESINLIISNELFCDLDREGLEKSLKEFYRILKPNGQMAHAELSPAAENPAQELFIKADSYSTEILAPEYEWFSPFSDEVAAIMHRLGFRDITVKYFETNLRLPFNEAVEQLKAWTVNSSFIKNNLEKLKKQGIEYPMEHVIFCHK